MTDSPTPRRHRGSRRAPRRSRRPPRRRRGLFGPIASATSVLLAIGPVVWLMANGTNPSVDDAGKVLNVATDSGTSVDQGSANAAVPLITITKTLPNGMTTPVLSTPALGPAAASASTPVTSATPVPTPRVTTVTVTPTAPRTTRGTTTVTPKPSRRTSTEPTRRETTSAPPATGGGTGAQERQVLDLTNQIRERQGCGPLRLDSALVEAAGKHASDMVRRHYMDHTNPDGEDPGDRMAAAGYRGSGWGENIAAGYDTAEKVVAAWMKSDGHRKNILNCRFTSIGIGYDAGQVKPDWGPGSWVQDFGRS